eukprot:gnl/TRDRNA2_/TRDRNA2_124465_c2_seq1.p1 gnl/TRDRNA2_/TRDRNA2_124465_c2~~gnl/TRDRNA2_/TRDRNA2_124465_c2_seq1.p1  ORF type:complete len:241 (+),score=33.64 gnl/TRDRNA2_/TRDRNA2_124465_c2_seq1:50-724(+)
MRKALELRYRLLPYHYSLAHAMYDTGRLWMRPLVMDYPHDHVVSDVTSQWMDGDLLVAPVLNRHSRKVAYLPNGTWYVFNTSEVAKGPSKMTGLAALDEIPVYVRQGSAIPLAPRGLQHTDELPGGTLEVQVYSGQNGSFELVEDDGETTNYESGQAAVRRIQFTWDDQAQTLQWKVKGTRAHGQHDFLTLSVSLFSPTAIRHSEEKEIGIRDGSVSFATCSSK